eukprot:193287-Rhodomonas_salina.1
METSRALVDCTPKQGSLDICCMHLWLGAGTNGSIVQVLSWSPMGGMADSKFSTESLRFALNLGGNPPVP